MSRDHVDLKPLRSLASLLACGFHNPVTGDWAMECVDGSYSLAQIGKLARKVVQSCLATRARGLQGAIFCWQFERVWIFCGVGKDDGTLILFTKHHPEKEEALRQAIRDFFSYTEPPKS